MARSRTGRVSCALRLCAALAVAAEAQKTVNVVVVGSGVGGLTAARTLADNWPSSAGQLNLTVVEAGSRIGGRTYTRRSIPGWGTITGAEADIGASWIHGSSAGHPVTRIFNALQWQGFVTSDNLVKLKQCAVGDTDECDEVENDRYREYKTLLGKAEDVAAESATDISMWQALGAVSDPGTYNRDHPLIQYHMTNALEFNTGASPQRLSGKYFNDDSQFEGDETLILGGYGQVPDALAAGSVRLSSACGQAPALQVTAVASDRKALTVTINRSVTGVKQNADGKLSVLLAGGDALAADHVVMATPLGVLKAGTISFQPTLPAATQTAINRLGFGNVLKIGLLFANSFWPQDTHYFGLAPTGTGPLSRAEKFSYFLNAKPASGRPILFTFAFGDSATEVEGWTDQQVQDAARASLQRLFTEAAVINNPITAIWRSTWGSDPLFRGAYSFAAVNSLPSDWAEISKPAYGNRLHFAGEHTSKQYRGTVHGALLSGQRAACEITSAETGAMVGAGSPASGRASLATLFFAALLAMVSACRT